MPVEGFWGQRNTGSRAMKKNKRLVWHFFKEYREPAVSFYRDHSRRVGEFYSLCKSRLLDVDGVTLKRQHLQPPQPETCKECYAIWRKLNAEGGR